MLYLLMRFLDFARDDMEGCHSERSQRVCQYLFALFAADKQTNTIRLQCAYSSDYQINDMMDG